MIKFSDGTTLQNGVVIGGNRQIKGALRESLEIELIGTDYQTVAGLFVDGAQFVLEAGETRALTDEDGNPLLNEDGTVQAVTETVTYDKSDYLVAGSITDRRDGSFVVQMACKTEAERLEEDNAELFYQLMLAESQIPPEIPDEPPAPAEPEETEPEEGSGDE